MSLRRWLSEGRLKPHRASTRETTDLLRVVARDMADAGVAGLSIDRRYATAYNAALQLVTVVIRASGYRTSGLGHHWLTFQLLLDLWGASQRGRVDFFDSCRQKRNVADYDCAGRVGEAELAELLLEALALQTAVLDWLRREKPDLLSEEP